MRLSVLALALALALLLVACDLPSLQSADSAETPLPTTPYGHGYLKFGTPLPASFFDNYPDDLPGGMALTNRLQEGDGSLEERMAAARAEIDTYPQEIYRRYGATQGAIWVLREALGEGKLFGADAEEPAVYAARPKTEEQRQLIGFATELLVDYDSPNAHLIAANLSVLRGLWTDAKIRAVAAQAAEIGTRYLVENTRCGESCIETGRGSQLVGPYDARVRLGVVELRKIAGA